MFLEEKIYANILKSVPVVTIDLCVIHKNKILLGKENALIPEGALRGTNLSNETFLEECVELSKQAHWETKMRRKPGELYNVIVVLNIHAHA